MSRCRLGRGLDSRLDLIYCRCADWSVRGLLEDLHFRELFASQASDLLAKHRRKN